MPDYGYLNARLRGMKTKLLSKGEYEKMLKSSGVRELMDIVHNTLLKAELDRALIRYKGVEALEEAFKNDFISACRKVMAITEKSQRKLVGILLGRWDVFNLKTILRGKGAIISPEDLERTLIPAGELDHLALRELAAQPGIKEVVDLLATWSFHLADPLVENLEGYFQDRNLVRLELALDRAFFKRGLRMTLMPGKNNRVVGDLLRSEIDIVNIMAKIRLILDDIDTYIETKEEKAEREKKEKAEARRLKKEEKKKLQKPKLPPLKKKASPPAKKKEKHPLPPIQEYFIPGGRELGGSKLEDMLRTRALGELFSLLAGTSYGRFISTEMLELEKIVDLAAFERTLEVDLVRRMIHLYRREPIGIAIAISYLWLRYNQLINLRIISRGKEFDIPENVLRGEMVYTQ